MVTGGGGRDGRLVAGQAWQRLILDTMAGHRVTELQTVHAGYSWRCRCAANSYAEPGVTGPQHQAQAVLDALRDVGWTEPVVIDGDVVINELSASSHIGVVE